MNIFIDDIRYPSYIKHKLNLLYPIDWVVIRSYNDFVNILKTDIKIDIISFDHDLDSLEYTGMDCLRLLINYFIEKGLKFPDWYVHTSNTVGRANLIGLIKNYLKNIEGIDIDIKYYHNGIIKNTIL